MRHAREDYNRIQDPEEKIGKDEPVFLLRAQDKFAPVVVRMWAELVEASGDRDLADVAFEHACEMDEWQIANGSKTPDGP
jgi:hypothetical protein